MTAVALDLHPCPAPTCQGTGDRIEYVDNGRPTADIRKTRCDVCGGTGEVTDEQRKTFWRGYFAARNAPWSNAQVLADGGVDAFDALQELADLYEEDR